MIVARVWMMHTRAHSLCVPEKQTKLIHMIVKRFRERKKELPPHAQRCSLTLVRVCEYNHDLALSLSILLTL